MRLCLIEILCLLGLAVSVAGNEVPPPNILWLTSEDNNVSWVGCYGNPHAETPNIDRLAAEGFQYMHAYANAPVCAPSRSTWITGINAISMGTHPMRSRYDIPHGQIPYYPDLLRANGYYTGNYPKTDYNIGGREDKACWDNPDEVDWQALKARQPFFQVINFKESHESRAQGQVENTNHDPADVRLRKYHPDLPVIRQNYAKYHDAVKRMDGDVGAALEMLEKTGLSESTIVIYNSDHGGVLPRSKRFLFESGLHSPLIIRIPKRYEKLRPAAPGSKIDRLVSFVDMPKTWLSLAGAEIPDVMQGTVFLGEGIEPEPQFHFAFRGRMDERCENARAVCDKRFLYIRNYMPYAPWMQHLNFLWKMKASQAWEEQVKSGRASEVQSRWFAPKGYTEELYDMQTDPDSVNNLIDSPEFLEISQRMRGQLRRWQESVHDAGMLPESEMVKRAADHGTTIYELVRNPKLYNLPALLDAADMALEKSPANRDALMSLLSSTDSGLRYWGIVGCFLLNEQEAGFRCLQDPSHEVRAMAAWLLINTGEKEKGFQCLDNLLKTNSYATLKVLNIMDWIGEDARVLLPTVKELNLENYEERIQVSIIAALDAKDITIEK
ncbi:Arylsulfatase [Novipirellula aureliae]|uniref:Arylsulfatase n=1 Tax=Novipirellula aureliae TaxID=2527966 RepID=A0A5C6DKM4_9BACT|nr:sulfatase [Novipirellula aureliae]TWU37923.1 Arylsulfatase [Novipirellula aureliae]